MKVTAARRSKFFESKDITLKTSYGLRETGGFAITTLYVIKTSLTVGPTRSYG